MCYHAKLGLSSLNGVAVGSESKMWPCVWRAQNLIALSGANNRVPAPVLNSRLALKRPWILKHPKSPWIALENGKKALKSLEFS